jgi:hypothetical protein
MLSVIMLSVIFPNVAMSSVVTPRNDLAYHNFRPNGLAYRSKQGPILYIFLK